MKYTFYKYQGTGNDFVMLDNRNNTFDRNNLDLVRKLCDRKFGIGADGLILIENHPEYDFEMVYFNSDGSQSFCGNGGRCTIAFAHFLKIFEKECSFLAIDGAHYGSFISNDEIHLKMGDVSSIEKSDKHFFINTGSPHYIEYVNGLSDYALVDEAKKIRYNDRFKADGTNVNFLEEVDGVLSIRTYERGVEDETLSCGTGVTAAAISYAIKNNLNNSIKVSTRGGN